MSQESSFIKFRHIIIPLIMSLGVVVWLVAKDISEIDLSKATFANFSIIALFFALGFITLRELAYMWRYKILTNGDLSWGQCFKVTMLCEFSSTITPSAVGGSSLAMVFMAREGIAAGRGTTITLITILFDELFFVVSCPLVFIFFDGATLFSTIAHSFATGIRLSFWIIYGIIALWTVVLFIGIFIRPRYITAVIMSIFKIKLLVKYRDKAMGFCRNLVEASDKAKLMPATTWVKCFAATAISWLSRYLMVCALFAMFGEGNNQFLVVARQSVVWLILMVTPTPGGSGVSEWLFTKYYSDMVSSVSIGLLLALSWRILSYYLYMIVGLCVIPAWLKKKNRHSAGFTTK